MYLELTLTTITLLVLAITSVIDIKTREVPDILSYGLIFVALGIRTIYSFEQGWLILLSGLLGFGICFLLACLFYYTDQWGGGDSKLLMAMGAVIGVAYPINSSSFSLLWFFLSMLFLGALFGMFWMLYLVSQDKKLFGSYFRKKLNHNKKTHLLLFLTSILLICLIPLSHFFLPLLPLPLGIFYTSIFVSIVEEHFFIKRIRVSNLTEGDWLAEKVFMGKKAILDKKTVDRRDILQLKSLMGSKATVLVKEGIPFIPSFLLAYLVFLFGDKIFPIVFSFIAP